MEAIDDRQIALDQVLEKSKLDNGTVSGKQAVKVIAQAEKELEFLKDCKSKLETIIGFEPTIEDYQNNQQLEWQLELEFRAENHLLCSGTIPPEHFATMRYHPKFPEIMAHVDDIKLQLANGNSYQFLMPSWKKDIGLLENKSNS